jgi:hypothetical protein
MDVNYTYGGEGDLGGTASNIIVASFGGESFKLYLDRGSNLPVGMTFNAPKMSNVVFFNKEVHPPADGTKDTVMFRKVDANEAMAEFTVRFSDYRAVNGVQLPFKWTQTIGGETDEIFEVTGYELNPANIGEKFQHQQIHWKTKKPDGQ